MSQQKDVLVAQLDDAAGWEHAKASNSIDELQAFKHFFPTSPHIAEADKAIAVLQAAAEEAKRKEAEAERARQAAAEAEKRKQDDAERAKQAAAAAAAAEEQRKQAEAEKARQAAADAEKRKQDEAEKARQAAAAAAAAEEQRKQAEAEKAKQAAAAAAAAEEQRKQAAAAEDKRKQEEAERASQAAAEAAAKAKAQEETCQREAADVADFVQARSMDALNALRTRAVCPKTFAAIDKGLRDVQVQECDSERSQVRDLGTDLDALKKAVAGFSCDAVAVAARGRIAQLEQEAARVAKACDDARHQVDTTIDSFAAGARDKLAAYLTRSECPDAQADAQQRISDIDERVSNAQDQLKKLGCYKVEPASKRFDLETQNAIVRFQRGAKLSVDGTHLSPDFMQTLASYTGGDACPALASIPPAETPSETPRERPREAPRAPLRQRAEPEPGPRAEPRKRRLEAEGSGAPQPRHAAPAAPAAAPSAPKPSVFIPN